MSWMVKLYETYEHALTLDLPQGDQVVPIFHTLQNAHINIVLNGEGVFRRASVLEKKPIILPATERSAGRSSGEAAHPLADKLQYVAGDYALYGGKKPSYFSSYITQLQQWCESNHSNPYIKAVYNYVKNGQTIHDLVNHGIIHVDETDKLISQWNNVENEPPALLKILPKTSGLVEQGDALVCWSVEFEGNPDSETWKSVVVQESWAAFCTTQEGNKSLCHVTGDVNTQATSHPAKLRHTGDKAKLISSNDLSGYTFRGRFTDTRKTIDTFGLQGVAIGVQTTQKAHNALQWLIAKQGFRTDSQVIVAWAVSNSPIPSLLQDTHSLFNVDDITQKYMQDDSDPEDAQEKELHHANDAGQSFALKLNKKMCGYKANLSSTEDVIIMGIDSATPGRMAIIFYQEMGAYQFIDTIEQWHKDTAWFQRHKEEVPSANGKKNKPKTIWPIGAPASKKIIEMAYGKTLTDSLKKNLTQRLLPCIVSASPIPIDIVNMCTSRAANPNGMEYWEWEQCLGIACALYKGYYIRHPNSSKRRNYDMALEEQRASRDYLYGRLLAVAERIEYIALQMANEKRPTNAERLMQRFADRPCTTWRTIELSLVPYMQRLKNARGGFLTNCQKELDAIYALFSGDDFTSDKPLSGEFLLGFHCQRLVLRDTKNTDGAESQSSSGE